jgi:hypothetical protein
VVEADETLVRDHHLAGQRQAHAVRISRASPIHALRSE